MTRTRKRWVKIGASRIERQDLETLSKAWREGHLVLCLGAGVSTPYGLPNWNDLVVELLLKASRRFTGFLVQYRRPLAQYLSDTANLSLPALARIVEHAFRPRNTAKGEQTFDEFVRDQLYRRYEEPAADTSLRAVARLVKRRWEADRRAVPLVATFNYDDLLEQELRREGVPPQSVYRPGDPLPAESVSVLHLNGYLPRKGEIPYGDVVFTEQHFHRVANETYHWSGTECVRLLRRYVVLFIGLSMTDPNLRRFLDLTYPQNDRRYLLRTLYTEPEATAVTALQTAARAEARRLGLRDGRTKSRQDAIKSLRHVLSRAKEWEEQLFGEMGIHPVWIRSHQDIGPVLDAIQ